ncbi:MAG: hypothetical protein ACTSPS_18950 [Promethearchaeota archaeon]
MSIIIFIKYENSLKEFFGRKLFNKENIIWAGHSAIVFDGEEEYWDEILIIVGMDETALEILKGESKIEKYKILRLSLIPSEAVKKANDSLDAFAKMEFDMTEGISPFAANNQSIRNEIFEKLEDKPFALINFISYRDVAIYPENYEGKKIESGKKAHDTYGMAAGKGFGKLGVRMYAIGEFKGVIAGEKEEWQYFNAVAWPSAEAVKRVYSIKSISETLVHRLAGMEKTQVYAAFPYEEYLYKG